MKKIIPCLLVILSTLSTPLHAGTSQKAPSHKSKDPKVIESEAGLIIQGWGIAIDAVYDERLDDLIKGYKLLNVVLTNNSQNIITLDPIKDKWELKDSLGKKVDAINHLRLVSEKLWESLPEGLRKNIEYPQAVKMNKSAKITLFFPKTADLTNFQALQYKSASIKKTFAIIMSIENNLEVEDPNDKNPDTDSFKQALKKYDGEERKSDRVNEYPKAPVPEGQTPETIVIPLD